MSVHSYRTVDVFTAEPLRGNPLAVVFDAEGLSDVQMQDIARWINLSETTFLLPPTEPGADYRVRIFTPGGELPFAGHPTLGTCHAWLEAGGRPQREGEVVQQCGVGLVRIRRSGARPAFAAPPMRASDVSPSMQRGIFAALGLQPEQVLAVKMLVNGPHWLSLLLDSAQTVLSLEPDHRALATLAKVGVIGAHAPGGDAQFEVRGFVSHAGVPEDPVTGSLNAALAQWLIADGRAPRRYVAAQGTRLGRAGRVFIEADDHHVWVGGDTITCIRGELRL
jgi:PhzF family phenazine biosynthesis protein